MDSTEADKPIIILMEMGMDYYATYGGQLGRKTMEWHKMGSNVAILKVHIILNLCLAKL
jgi:hypothetical protein